MRLLVDARVGWGHGIGRVIANTVPRIAHLRPDWIMDALVEPADVPTAQEAFAGAANLSVLPCSVGPFSMAEQLRLSYYARGYDLTWFTNYWVPLAWRGPFAVTVHDMLHLIPEFFPASPLKRQLSRRTFAKVRASARVVMFDSRFTQRAFARMVGEPRRGVTVHLAADHLDYGEPRPMGSRRRQLMAVSASKEHKNFDLLLRAWRHVRVADHWELVIVSPDTTLRSSVDVEALARESGRTRVLRGVSNEALAALYGESAILLMPSLYEGFGLPLLEGMLAGALCIGSAAGAMVEIAGGAFFSVVNGRDLDGWVDAIEAACTIIDQGEPNLDPLLRHNFDCARRFRWDSTAEQVAAELDAARQDMS